MKICFNTTSRCNVECGYCFRSKNEKELEAKDLKTILQKLKACNVNDVTWSGGEFFLHPDSVELLKATKNLGFYCTVATNGILLNDKLLKKALPYIDKINLSLDFLDDDLNQSISRGHGYLNIFTKLIKDIQYLKPSVLIKVTTVALKQNYNTIEDIYNILLDLDINIWQIVNYCTIRNSSQSKTDKYKISQSQFDNIKNKYLKKSQQFAVVVQDDDDFQNQLVISPSGMLCVSENNVETVLIKNILKESLQSIKKHFLQYEGVQLLHNLNLNTYKMFFEVAIDGNLTRVAKRNFVAQPAVSRAIKTLEDNLQTKLFNRTKNGMILTPKGIELFHYVSKIMDLFKLATMKMFENDNFTSGRLNIGAPSHIASFLLFDKIREFHNDYLKIEINIVSRSSKELISMLQLNELDFIIDTSPLGFNNMDNLMVDSLFATRHCFVAPYNHNYKDIISIKDLKNLPLILPAEFSSPRKDLDIITDSLNASFNNVISISTSEMIVNAVKKNMGIGYVIYDLIKPDIDNKVLREIDVVENLPNVTINLIYKNDTLTSIAENFITNYLK